MLICKLCKILTEMFLCIGGISPPVVEWKKILDEMNEKTRKLEEDYQATCIHRKVSNKLVSYI